jgi:hypothetical protein
MSDENLKPKQEVSRKRIQKDAKITGDRGHNKKKYEDNYIDRNKQ